jgi:hypothetical protein
MTSDAAARLRGLTAKNRLEPAVDRERELMGLRRLIAVERLSRSGPISPVEPADVSFELEQGLPVVHAGDLDAAVARQAITAHGSLIVRNLIPQPDVRRLVSAIDNVFASFDAAVTGVGEVDGAWYAPLAGREPVDATRLWLRTKGGVLTGDSPRATFVVADVFAAQGIDRIAQDYLGQPPILSLDKWTLRRGDAVNGIEWHQDGAFLGAQVRALNVWLALSACGVAAPSLDVVPRRLDRIVPTGTDGASYSWSVGGDVADDEAGPDGWSRLAFGPGDALLFDDKLLHRTGSSPEMSETRYAIETWFFGPAGDTGYVDIPLIL